MSIFEKILIYYKKHLYSKEHLKVFLEKGFLTLEEYNQIIENNFSQGQKL